LRALAGIIPPKKGKIFLQGKLLQSFNRQELARYVVYLPQDRTIPLPYTAREIVLSGQYARLNWYEQESEKDRKRADLCLSLVGAEEWEWQPVTELSGGQRQRVLLARTFMQDGAVYLLDEPTAELDPLYEERIFQLLQELAGAGKVVVTALHDLSLAQRYCQRLLLVGQGTLVADGSPQQVLTDEAVSRAYGSACHLIREADHLVLTDRNKKLYQEQQKGKMALLLHHEEDIH
jgi:iron complex transport system ATP-binding protein